MTKIEQGQSQAKEKPNFFPDKETLWEKLEAFPARQEILDYLGQYGVDVDDFLEWPERSGLYLSDLGILRHFLAGNILIHPFNPEHLTPDSYEVSLGKYYYRQQEKARHSPNFSGPRYGLTASREEIEEQEGILYPILNPYDPRNLRYFWRKNRAFKAALFAKRHGITLEGIKDDDQIIVLRPHEMILAHTQEFIGGRNVIATSISARSSTGRNLVEVCNDANLGHIGFINRWTLEIRNKSDDHAIPLVVGKRYAQIAFMETGPSAQSYQGQYQNGSEIERIIATWRPEMMLPQWKEIISLR